MDVKLDEISYVTQVHGTYHELNTEGRVILGSAERDMLVEDLTRGHFRDGFNGCMRDIKIQGLTLDTSGANHLQGQNIDECMVG